MTKKQPFFSNKKNEALPPSPKNSDGDAVTFATPQIPAYLVHYVLEHEATLPKKDQVPLRQGMLSKTGPHKIQKRTKGLHNQRWFVLYPSELQYFEKFYDETPLGVIKVPDIVNVFDLRSKYTNALKLTHGFEVECKDRTYILISDSEKSKHDWMVSLKKASKSLDAWSSVRTAVVVVDSGANGKKIVRVNVDLAYDDIRQTVFDKMGIGVDEKKELWDVSKNNWLKSTMTSSHSISDRADEKIVVNVRAV
mmetsp:Transcript_39141/g.54590  ORF Transcript_39141/g.54590 Transcript_39141/m.54590 type:complete len:251 (-) Transcript_39141:72-824(-)